MEDEEISGEVIVRIKPFCPHSRSFNFLKFWHNPDRTISFQCDICGAGIKTKQIKFEFYKEEEEEEIKPIRKIQNLSELDEVLVKTENKFKRDFTPYDTYYLKKYGIKYDPQEIKEK